jgi:hypothetical protein
LRRPTTLSSDSPRHARQRGAYSWQTVIVALQSQPIDYSIFWLFVAGIAWVPFWYGSNDWIAWGINAIIFPGLTALYECSLLARKKRHPIAISYVAVPAALFAAVVLWIALQTMTWIPTYLVNPIWQMAGDAIGYPVAGSISVNRDMTVLALMRLITAASAFWLAMQLCRDGRRANQLLVAIATIAALYSIYGIIAMKTGPLPWLTYISPGGRALSATFINPDSFATYAAIGLIVIAALSLRHYGDVMRRAAGNRRLQLAFFIELTGREGALLLGAGFVVLVALLLTSSRGGVFAVVFGLFVVAALARQRWDAKAPVLLLAIGTTLVIATLFAFGGSVGVKLESGGVYDESRFTVFLLTLRSIFNEPLLGYGYGTFADVFPMYRDRSIDIVGTWSQAHNTYLEIFQGLGLLIGTMLIVSVAIIAWRCIKGATQRHQDITAPVMAVGVTGVVAAHALVDFSLQIQAVALTFIVLLGAGVAQAASSRTSLND